MGKKWSVPSVAVWKECFRVLKPGGHLLAFGGTRTFDLISLGLRAAGFENRDSIASDNPGFQWKQGQGFPKSLNIGKAIDKSKGAERTEVIGKYDLPECTNTTDPGMFGVSGQKDILAPATPEAAQWEGWGTALKPSWEPILVFRKPVEGTVAENVLKYGTGGMNIDGTRVRHSGSGDFEKHKAMVDRLKEQGGSLGDSWKNSSDLSGASEVSTAGRWPPNSVMVHSEECKKAGTRKIRNASGSVAGTEPSHTGDENTVAYGEYDRVPFTRYADGDGNETIEAWECVPGCPIRALDEQSGDRPVSGRAKAGNAHGNSGAGGLYDGNWGDNRPPATLPNDSGGASRFFPQFEGQVPPEAPFMYTGKATKREATLDGQVPNKHPTKKPLALMQWLVRLVTPKGGICLDPFVGSGTTAVAAIEEGMRFIGIERDPAYHADTVKRVGLVYSREEVLREQEDVLEELFNGG